MKDANWKDIAELIGLAAIVASLIFVGMQMKQEQRIAEAQTYVDSAGTYIEVSRWITENQVIWISGLDGADLSIPDQATFDQLVRAWHLRKVNQWQVARRLRTTNPDQIVKAVALDTYIHPGLRHWLERFSAAREYGQDEENEGAHSASFNSEVSAALREIDRANPPLPKHKAYFLY